MSGQVGARSAYRALYRASSITFSGDAPVLKGAFLGDSVSRQLIRFQLFGSKCERIYWRPKQTLPMKNMQGMLGMLQNS